MKLFALIGAAGYIAHRHMRAIRDTGNLLVAAMDKNDSVGIIDSYFPNSDFFTEFERFDRHIEKLRREKSKHVDYVSICSPNYLHDAHIRFALRVGADAICEKPLVLNPWNLDSLGLIEKETGKKIYTVLQLRLHPTIIELKRKIDSDSSGKIHDIDLSYITSRGKWYLYSWKGEESKAGGVATNIGIHFFDMLSWIFGDVEKNILHVSKPTMAAGYLEMKKARVRWFLSTNEITLPAIARNQQQRTWRSITIDGEEMEFSNGFTDLHTRTYEEILAGNGFGMESARQSIEIAHCIRTNDVVGLHGDYHPYLREIL